MKTKYKNIQDKAKDLMISMKYHLLGNKEEEIYAFFIITLKKVFILIHNRYKLQITDLMRTPLLRKEQLKK